MVLPDAIDFETAAAMMLQGMTVQYLFRRTFPLKGGETILFHAAAGGVGLIACQWARAMGLQLIGTAGGADKCKLALEHGASHVIDYRSENFVERVKAITGGKGDNVAVNINVDRLQSVGGNKRDLEELVRMLKPHFEALARRTR